MFFCLAERCEGDWPPKVVGLMEVDTVSENTLGPKVCTLTVRTLYDGYVHRFHYSRWRPFLTSFFACISFG